jgi:hypothetical protein
MFYGKIPPVQYYVQQCFHFIYLVLHISITIRITIYLVLTKEDLITIIRSESFPLRVTGWPVELMAYAFLVVSPPEMIQRFDEVSAVILHQPVELRR